MSTRSPSVPTPDELAKIRKSWKQPTQAPAPKGAILHPSAGQFAQIRKSMVPKKKVTQGPPLKGVLTQPSVDQFVSIRKSFKKPSLAPVVITTSRRSK